MSLLIVGESRPVRDVIRASLAAAGFPPERILEAHDGAAALHLLEDPQCPVRLVLTDWFMPRVNGLELLRRMKRSERLHRIPVVFVTTRERGECIRTALREGASDYLVFPFRLDAFAHKILRVAARAGLRPGGQRTATFLVADDSASMRAYLRAALDQVPDLHAITWEASDGIQALETLSREPVDVAVVDWEMPNMDGYDLLKKMKSTRALQDVPVIMITGTARRERVIEALREGASAFLVKPVRPAAICEKVANLLDGRPRDPLASDSAVIRRSLAGLAGPDGPAVPLLDQLPPDALEALRDRARRRLIGAGETLVRYNELVECFHVIQNGVVELRDWADAPARERREAGDCLVETAFLTRDSARQIACTRTPVDLLSLSREAFDLLVRDYPFVACALAQVLSRRAERAGSEAWIDLVRSPSIPIQDGTLFSVAELAARTMQTGVLRLHRCGASGLIYFVHGEIEHVRDDDGAGSEAFHRLLAWTSGCCSFHVGTHVFKSQGLPGTLPLLAESVSSAATL